MKYIFLFFVLNLVCFGILAVVTKNLPLFAPEQLEYLKINYGISDNEAFELFFDEMKNQGLILEIVNKQNVEIVGVVAFLNLFTLLISLHLFIDKLFFRTITESPSIRDAVRRALVLSIICFGFLVLKLYNILEWYIVIFVLLLSMFIEIVIFNLKKTRQLKNETAQIQATA